VHIVCCSRCLTPAVADVEQGEPPDEQEDERLGHLNPGHLEGGPRRGRRSARLSRGLRCASEQAPGYPDVEGQGFGVPAAIDSPTAGSRLLLDRGQDGLLEVKFVMES
jgi:hypothetical protein